MEVLLKYEAPLENNNNNITLMGDIWRIYLNNEAPLENNNNITLMGDIWRIYLNNETPLTKMILG